MAAAALLARTDTPCSVCALGRRVFHAPRAECAVPCLGYQRSVFLPPAVEGGGNSGGAGFSGFPATFSLGFSTPFLGLPGLPFLCCLVSSAGKGIGSAVGAGGGGGSNLGARSGCAAGAAGSGSGSGALAAG